MDVDELLVAVTTAPEIEKPETGDTIEKRVTFGSPESRGCVLPKLQVLVPYLRAVPDSVEVPPAALIVVGFGVHVTTQVFHASE